MTIIYDDFKDVIYSLVSVCNDIKIIGVKVNSISSRQRIIFKEGLLCVKGALCGRRLKKAK